MMLTYLPDLSKINLILYDLGGVHYRVDYQASVKAFSQLALQSQGQTPVFSQLVQDDVFNMFEEGKISATEFRNQLRIIYQLVATDDQIDAAWNSLLGGLISGRVEYLRQVKQHHRIALLSNTNEIHYNAIVAECTPLFEQFESCFFSHQIKMRKPNAEIFEFVLAELKLSPEKVLFIDDSPQHIESANRLGFRTWHLKNPTDLITVVPPVL